MLRPHLRRRAANLLREWCPLLLNRWEKKRPVFAAEAAAGSSVLAPKLQAGKENTRCAFGKMISLRPLVNDACKSSAVPNEKSDICALLQLERVSLLNTWYVFYTPIILQSCTTFHVSGTTVMC